MNYQNGYSQQAAYSHHQQQQQQALQQHLQQQQQQQHQQQPNYANANAQVFQAQQQLPGQQFFSGGHVAQPQQQYGGASQSVAMGSTAGMMHTGLQQHIGRAHQSPYTSSPYSQSTTASSIPAAQSLRQTPQQPSRSPPFQNPPSTSQHTPQQNQQQQQPLQPQQQQQMFAPPLPPPPQPSSQPSSGQSQTMTANPNSKPILQPPLSPSSSAREKERVSVLLDINRDLLQEVVNLQGQGKAGIPGQTPGQSAQQLQQQQQQQSKEESKDSDPKPAKPPSREFIDCMRRLQANLAYLAAIADRSHKPASAIPPSPAILDAPPHLPTLAITYAKLKELFPDAKTTTLGGMTQVQKPAAQVGAAQGVGGMGGTSGAGMLPLTTSAATVGQGMQRVR
ncbi:MAG: hypothetical protein M1827_005657 [Pycnora praestabilis]|nr:MAG: hypothetical protein M1827_005657 [Pycnora praestabilis]